MKILVIDDEEMIRILSERILVKAGFEVLLASDGQSGIDILMENNESIDLAIVDMNMDGLSGIETITQIKNISKDTHCIISSGEECNTDDLPAEIKSDIKFLMKPYRSKVMVEFVNEILQTA